MREAVIEIDDGPLERIPSGPTRDKRNPFSELVCDGYESIMALLGRREAYDKVDSLDRE